MKTYWWIYQGDNDCEYDSVDGVARPIDNLDDLTKAVEMTSKPYLLINGTESGYDDDEYQFVCYAHSKREAKQWIEGFSQGR